MLHWDLHLMTTRVPLDPTRAPTLRGPWALSSEQLLLRRTNHVVSHSWSCVQVMGVLCSGVGWREGGIIVLVVDILIFWKGMDEKKKDIRLPICSYFLSWFHRNSAIREAEEDMILLVSGCIFLRWHDTSGCNYFKWHDIFVHIFWQWHDTSGCVLYALLVIRKRKYLWNCTFLLCIKDSAKLFFKIKDDFDDRPAVKLKLDQSLWLSYLLHQK